MVRLNPGEFSKALREGRGSALMHVMEHGLASCIGYIAPTLAPYAATMRLNFLAKPTPFLLTLQWSVGLIPAPPRGHW